MRLSVVAISITLILTLATVATAQNTLPHPYISGSFNLMPSGYYPTSFGAGAGLMYDLPHLVFDSYAGYDTGRKSNDATVNNYSGHDRFLRGFLSYKQDATYLGAGARWSQLSTSNYTKGGDASSAGSWHPELGIGHDFNHSAKFSPDFLRAQLAYMFHPSKETTQYPNGVSCAGCGNGSQGVDISFWFPSPASRTHRHLFFRLNAVVYRFHDTITDPKNISLATLQSSRHHLADSTEFNLGWRF